MSSTHNVNLFGRTIRVAIYDPNTLAARVFAEAAETSADEAAATAALLSGELLLLNTALTLGYETAGEVLSNSPYGAGAWTRWVVGGDVGDDITEGVPLSAVTLFALLPGATATKLRLSIISRALGSSTVNDAPPQTGDIVHFTQDYSLASLGMVADELRASQRLPFPGIIAADEIAGRCVLIDITALDADDDAVQLGIGARFDGAFSGPQRKNGWYAETGLLFGVGSNFRVAHRFETSEFFNAVANEAALDDIRQDIDDLTSVTVAEPIVRTTDGYSAFPTGSPSSKAWAVGFMGEDIADGALISAVGATVHRGTGIATFECRLYSRAAADMAAPDGDDTLEWADWVSVDAGSITEGEFGDVLFGSPNEVRNGAANAYYFEVRAKNSSGAIVDLGFGSPGSGAGLNQVERGFYRNPDNTAWLGLNETFALSIRVQTSSISVSADALPDGIGAPQPYILSTPVLAFTTVSAFSVEVAGTVKRDGGNMSVSGSITFPAASSGNDRIDLIVMDRLTGAFSRVAGTDRDAGVDSLEYQGAVPAGSVLVGRALVTSAAATVVNTTLFSGLVKVGSEAQMERHRQRNMDLTRRTRGKALRGDPVVLAGYGDSLTAIGYTAENAPNGGDRDRITYLADYPSDTQALVPQVNLGQGTTDNILIGWNWHIKAALDAMAGADVVEYLNFGIAGTTSANSTSGGRDNGLFAARIALLLAANPDLTVIGFGMNEREDTTIYTNLLNMVGQVLEEDSEVALHGVPRPSDGFVSNSYVNWVRTNRAIEAAAMDTGVAYISTMAITSNANIGAMGIPPVALGSTNIAAAGNHPGIFEMATYGRNAVLQLGL